MKSYAYAARQRIEDLHAFLWRVLRNETTSFLRRVRFEPSIDRPVSATDGRTLANTLPDPRAAVPEEIAIRAEVGREVRVVLGKMPSRDQQILKMYYWDHLTDAEIAVKLALTRERVGQIRRGALNRMKEALRSRVAKGECGVRSPSARPVRPATRSYPAGRTSSWSALAGGE